MDSGVAPDIQEQIERHKYSGDLRRLITELE
jgi:hypothetical protein